jgi:hypothetical protein
MNSRKPKGSKPKPGGAKLTLKKRTLKDLGAGSKGAADVRGGRKVCTGCPVGGS